MLKKMEELGCISGAVVLKYERFEPTPMFSDVVKFAANPISTLKFWRIVRMGLKVTGGKPGHPATPAAGLATGTV